MMSKVQSYVLREAAIPFFSLLLLGLSLLVVNRLLKVLPWLFEFNIPLGDLLGVLSFLIPSFLIYALPIAVWVGWMVGYGRLGTDGELAALASVGASPLAIIKSGYLSGMVFFLLALAICQWQYGQGRQRFQQGISELAQKAAGASLQPGTIAHLSESLWIAVPDTGQKEGNVFIIRDPDLVLSVAKTAPADGVPGFKLLDGLAYFRQTTDPTIASFRSGVAQIDALASGVARPGAREMSLSALWQSRDRADYKIEFHQRLALSMALLLAPLAAFAAAPRRARSSRGRSMVASIGGFLVYYGLFTIGKQAAIKGWVTAGVGLWAGNCFLGVLAFWAITIKIRKPGLP